MGRKKLKNYREKQVKPENKARLLFLSRISKKSLYCSLLLSFAIMAFVIHDFGYSSNVSLQYVLQDSQTRNYRFFTDNLSGGYPFGQSNWFDKTITGSNQIQTVTLSVPRNSVDKLRFDPSYVKSGQNQLYLYQIVISDFFTRTEITPSEIEQAFHGYPSLKLIAGNNAVKVTFNQPNQFAEAPQGWHGSKTLLPAGVIVIILLSLVFIVAFYTLFYYLSYLRRINSQGNLTFRRSLPYLVGSVVVIPLIITLYSLILQYGDVFSAFSWVKDQYLYFAENYVLIVLIYLAFLVFGRLWIATICTGIPVLLLTLVNYYKLLYRGTPVLPWDLSLVSEVDSVTKSLKFVPSANMVGIVLLFVVLVIINAFFPKIQMHFERKWKQLAFNAIPLVLSILCLLVYIPTCFFNVQLSVEDQWDETSFYKQASLLPAFLDNVSLLKISQPDGYSKQRMGQIVQEVLLDQRQESTDQNLTAIKKPNIIMIMSESFWDVTQLKGVTFEKEEFPTIDWLRKNAVSGYALTSIYGGGTSCTEFEALTGFTTQFLPTESTPYQQIVLRPFFSLADYLKGKGYVTEAMHPYLATNWNRNVAYPNMGFDSFLSQDGFTSKDMKRGYISDTSVTNQIIEEYEKHKKTSDKPWMNMTVTVQNHPTYTSSNFPKDEWIKFKGPFSQAVSDGFTDLATGLHESDLALGMLIDYFKNQKDPTIIVFYGDHMSPPGGYDDIFTETGAYQSTADEVEKQYTTHRVPIVMWNNYSNVKKDIGLISSYQISATMMQTYGLQSPPIFSFLDALKKVSPGYSLKVVLSPDGTYDGTLTTEQQKYYDEYRLLQYDYIYGKQYAAALWK